MAPPASVVIAGHPIAIEVVDDPGEALARDLAGHTIGMIDIERGRMRIRGGGEQSPTNTREVVLHEVIHGVLSCAYLDAQKDVFRNERMGERVVEALGTGLLDTLRRNPELVAYLVAA